jgi:4-amino-4-deoxy-L-arabinose transferase-like glycosyltransferase
VRTFDPGWVVPSLLSNYSSESSLSDPQPTMEREAGFSGVAEDRVSHSVGRVLGEKVPSSWVMALAVLLFLYFFTCGVPRLFDQIDGQYAGAAREMMERGDWLTPTQNGVPRLQKPPLVYWCEVLSMRVFGVNEFGARFPVALATVGWFLATGLLARRVVGTWSAGVAGALTLAMFTGTFFFTHLVMPEAFLSCFLTLSFWALLKATQAAREPDRRWEGDRWLMVAWCFIALSTLTKGIHGLLIPVAALSFTAWWRPSMRVVWRRFLFRPHGWLLLLAVLVPWYLLTEQRYPGFLKDHFFNEQIGSALGRRSPPDSDRVPLCILWLEHLVLLFPISLLFPAAVRAAFRSRKVGRSWVSDDGFLLLWWFLVVAIGISFANTQDYYLMIVWAPVAVWIAWTVTRNKISFKWPAIVVSLLGISGLLVGLVLAISSSSESADSSRSRTLIGDTILNVFQVLPATAWRGIIPLLFIASTSALVVGISAFIFNRKGRSEFCLAGFAFLMAAVFAIGTRAMQLIEDEFSSAKIAKLIDARDGSGGMVIAEGDPNDKTTLFFYLHRPIFWVNGHPNIEFATRTLRIGRDHYLKREQVAKAWRETKQIFLVIEGDALSEWAAYLHLGPERSNPIGTCGSRVILANR